MSDARTDFFTAADPDQTATVDPRTAFFTSAEPKKAAAREPVALPENPINAAIGGFVRQTAAGMGATTAGGLRGLYDIATGQGADQAAQDVRQIQQGSLGYQPASPAEAAGARAAASPWNPLNWPGMAFGWAGKKAGGAAEAMGAPPIVSAAAETAPAAIAALAQPVRGLMKRDWSPYDVAAENGPSSAADIAAKTVEESPQSTSAAAASPRVSNTTPQLQQAIVRAAQKTGGAVNPDALARHVEADTLPVPVPLTEGEALGDVARISYERNARGKLPDLAKFYQDRDGLLKQNLQALRDEVGPDVFSRNEVEHGDTLIKSYQTKGDTRENSIDADYQALRDANGGKFPVDVKKLLSNVEDDLHQKLLYEHAPAQLGQLKSLADKGNMSFEQFEAMRTNLARTMRSSTDGNERAAAGAIRQQMEELPLSGDAAKLKPLADKARANARSYYAELEADPAYKAAMDGSVSPDKFVKKFVLGATRDNAAKMRENLADDPTALQTIGVAAIDHLRDAARIDPQGNGTFSQAGYNKALRFLDPKIRALVSSAHADTLEQLGNVARYTQQQPAGSFVNNSNTFVAQAAEQAAGLMEGALNAKTGIPLASMARGALSKRAAKTEVKRITAPGAGLDVLETKP